MVYLHGFLSHLKLRNPLMIYYRQVQSLTDRCSKLETELRKEKMKSMMTPPPAVVTATPAAGQAVAKGLCWPMIALCNKNSD